METSVRAHLEEANVVGVLLEAATAQVQAILANDAVMIVACSAENRENSITIRLQWLGQVANGPDRLTSVSSRDRSFADVFGGCFQNPFCILFCLFWLTTPVGLYPKIKLTVVIQQGHTHAHSKPDRETSKRNERKNVVFLETLLKLNMLLENMLWGSWLLNGCKGLTSIVCIRRDVQNSVDRVARRATLE